MKRARLAIFSVLVVLASQPVLAEWQPDPDDEVQVKAAAAIQQFHDRVPRTAPFFEEAYGYAILHNITRLAVGFGGAYGRGIVIEQDQYVGKTSYWQFTGGIQAGIKNFSMIIFFKDKNALDYYKANQAQFMGQAGVDVLTWGAHGTPGYNDGVAVMTVTRLGLMGEFSYSGAWFRYFPDEEE